MAEERRFKSKKIAEAYRDNMNSLARKYRWVLMPSPTGWLVRKYKK